MLTRILHGKCVAFALGKVSANAGADRLQPAVSLIMKDVSGSPRPWNNRDWRYQRSMI
jgi:hypothetical protein